MAEDVLHLDRAVEGDVGKPLVHGGDDAERMRRRVEEVGIAERDVAGAGVDELLDVGEHRLLVDPTDAAVEHHRHRTVAAPVCAPVGGQDRSDESLLATDLEPRVAVERLQQVACREITTSFDCPRHRLTEVSALLRVEAEDAHRLVDASSEVAGESGRRVHRHRERHLVGPLDCRGVPRVDGHVERTHVVAVLAQVRHRGSDRARLLAELVGGDEEDPHPVQARCR